MKKHLLLLVMLLLSITETVAEEAIINGIKYNLVSKLQSAEVISNNYSGRIDIPSTIEYGGLNYKVTTIGDYAFSGCSHLTSVSIPISVTSIGASAFSYCSNLTSVNIYDLEQWCKISFQESTSNPLSYAHHLYLNGKEITKLVIPNTVTSIGGYAFYGCRGLTSVTIGNNVDSIGSNAFFGCTGLTSVNINDLERWCKISFQYETNPLLYAHHLYLNGKEITELVIPNTVTSIGDNTFFGCTGLTSVTIPNSVISIGSSAFSECSGLNSVKIPNSITSIKPGTFSGCSALTSVEIPDNVTNIDDYAFYKCSSLTTISLGSRIKTIGSEAFAFCTDLIEVYCHAAKVPSAGSDCFYNSYINYATLYVPKALISSYKDRSPWNSFKEIIAMTIAPADAEDVTVTWPMGRVSQATLSPEEAGIASYKVGDGLFVRDAWVWNDITYTLLQPVVSDKGSNTLASAKSLNKYIEFCFTPVGGVFTPTSVSFDIIKRGTGDPSGFATIIDGESNEIIIDENFIIRRNLDGDDSPINHVLSVSGAVSSDKTVILRIYVGKLSIGKSVGIANVVISGEMIMKTNIDGVKMEKTTSHEASIYNLNGVRVTTPRKGLYIMRLDEGYLQGKNCKKVMVK